MKLILFHPQGNANVRASAIAFAESDMLAEFHTSIACFEGSFLDNLANISFLSELKKRSLELILQPYTHTEPFMELGRLLAARAGIKKLLTQETGYFSVQAITRNLDKKIADIIKKSDASQIDGVYAYEDGAYQSFNSARNKGYQNIYDLPTGYWRAKLRILEEEKKRFPEWKSTITGLFDSEEKLRRKDEEIKMASVIFVASKFTKSTLSDYPGKLPPVQVIPYGFPEVGSVREYRKHQANEPLKILFVGNLSQQKGIAYLAEAIATLEKHISLTLIGRKADDNCEALNEMVAKHNWIPSLHHDEILKIMREHDVLVFPTLFDGFGLVISEAMSQGTPVIATFNSAGPDLIEHDKNGWLIETGSTIALKSVLEDLIANPEKISFAGKEAMETARRRPWKVFRDELSAAVKNHYKTLAH